jgi:hypothetical protein
MTRPDETTPLVFECTVDQLVASLVEWYQWSPQARRTKWVSVVTFVVVMAGTFTYFAWSGEDNDPLAAAISAVVAVVFGVAYWFGYDYSVRRRTRRFVLEMTRGRDPVACEVAVTSRHLRSKASGVEATFDWDTCAELRERPNGVHFIFRAGPVFVPSAAFGSAAERERFVARARDAIRAYA